jgi:hypothetical protein
MSTMLPRWDSLLQGIQTQVSNVLREKATTHDEIYLKHTQQLLNNTLEQISITSEMILFFNFPDVVLKQSPDFFDDVILQLHVLLLVTHLKKFKNTIQL